MTTYTSNTYEGRYLELSISEKVNPTNNTSTLSWTLASKGGIHNFYSIADTTIKINGKIVYSKTQTDFTDEIFPAKKGDVSGTIDVLHDSDGSKSISVEFKTRVYFFTAVDYGGTLQLTTIDRTAPTINISSSNITSNSVTITAKSSHECLQWDHSIDGGSNYTFDGVSRGTTYTKTITGLSPNTEYNIIFRGLRSYNYVLGASSVLTIKTLGYTKIKVLDWIVVDNDSVTLKFDATVYDSTFKHVLYINDYDTKTNIFTIEGANVQNGTNNLTFTKEQRDSVLRYMHDKKLITGCLIVDTYDSDGLTKIGEDYSTFYIHTISDNSSPTFITFTYEDTNNASKNITEANDIFIKNISNLKINLTAATAKNYATMSGYSVTIGTKTVTSNASNTEIDFGPITDAQASSIIVTAIDSRGWTTSVEYAISVKDYEPPYISTKDSFIRRTNDVDKDIIAYITGSLTPITFGLENKNPLKSMKYRYKNTDVSSYPETWNDVNSTYLSSTDETFTYDDSNMVSLDSAYSYYIEIKVEINCRRIALN